MLADFCGRQFPMVLDETHHRLFLECGHLPAYWSLIPKPVSKSQPAKSPARRTISSTIRVGAESMSAGRRVPRGFRTEKGPTSMTESRVTRLCRAGRRVLLVSEWGKPLGVPAQRRHTAKIRVYVTRPASSTEGGRK
jgi:hypothetical protein